jgi:hypothetical protein
MKDLGYVEGNDFVIEWRSADWKFERLRELAVELVKLKDALQRRGGQLRLRNKLQPQFRLS